MRRKRADAIEPSGPSAIACVPGAVWDRSRVAARPRIGGFFVHHRQKINPKSGCDVPELGPAELLRVAVDEES
jgi:hypothetical protein